MSEKRIGCEELALGSSAATAELAKPRCNWGLVESLPAGQVYRHWKWEVWMITSLSCWPHQFHSHQTRALLAALHLPAPPGWGGAGCPGRLWCLKGGRCSWAHAKACTALLRQHRGGGFGLILGLMYNREDFLSVQCPQQQSLNRSCNNWWVQAPLQERSDFHILSKCTISHLPLLVYLTYLLSNVWGEYI